MTIGELFFWAFIGMPIAATLLWWAVLLVAMVVQGIGKAFK